MIGRRIVLVEAQDRRRHVLALARASATAELVADWAERTHTLGPGDECASVPGRDGIRLPSLQDFVTPRPPTEPTGI
jgi:hypothetical protein